MSLLKNYRISLLSLSLAVAAITATASQTFELENGLYTNCSNPRPEVCAQNYDPVCATRDTGIRCFKAPCPSSEKVTYANACMACSDPDVYGYLHDGTCEVHHKRNENG